MSDYFSTVEPMDIEGEAACAAGPQLVTAKGEQRAGVDVKRTSSHHEADNLLSSDNGEPTDDQNIGFPDEEGRGSIPSKILFSTWVKAFRTSCGYDFPAPMGGGKAQVFCKRPLKTNKTTSLILTIVQCIPTYSA